MYIETTIVTNMLNIAETTPITVFIYSISLSALNNDAKSISVTFFETSSMFIFFKIESSFILVI